MLQSIFDESLPRDQQQGRKGNRERRGRQLAGVVHGVLSLSSLLPKRQHKHHVPGARENIATFSQLSGQVAALFQPTCAATIAPSKRYRCMSIEKRALLDHAERCRRVASEVTHREAAQRLQAMAGEYETRAASLDEDDVRLKHAHQRRGHQGNGSAREG